MAAFSAMGQSGASNENVFVKVEIHSGPDPIKLETYLNRSRLLTGSEWEGIPVGRHVVPIELVVDIHGKPGRFKAVRPSDPRLYNRAVRLLKEYPGEWQPASQCGRLVNSYWKYNIVFEVR